MSACRRVPVQFHHAPSATLFAPDQCLHQPAGEHQRDQQRNHQHTDDGPEVVENRLGISHHADCRRHQQQRQVAQQAACRQLQRFAGAAARQQAGEQQHHADDGSRQHGQQQHVENGAEQLERDQPSGL